MLQNVLCQCYNWRYHPFRDQFVHMPCFCCSRFCTYCPPVWTLWNSGQRQEGLPQVRCFRVISATLFVAHHPSLNRLFFLKSPRFWSHKGAGHESYLWQNHRGLLLLRVSASLDGLMNRCCCNYFLLKHDQIAHLTSSLECVSSFCICLLCVLCALLSALTVYV